MAKKRNCRRTPEEVSIHEEAVKLRKMTDAQLLEAFANANIPGVGKITLKKMNTFAKDNGYL